MHNSVLLLAPANHPKVSIYCSRAWMAFHLALSVTLLSLVPEAGETVPLPSAASILAFPTGSSGSFCLSATPGHQSLIDTCHTCAKDLGEMQAAVSIPLSPPLRVWDVEAYSSLWWSKVSECVYFYGLVSIAYTSKLSILVCPLKSHDH